MKKFFIILILLSLFMMSCKKKKYQTDGFERGDIVHISSNHASIERVYQRTVEVDLINPNDSDESHTVRPEFLKKCDCIK